MTRETDLLAACGSGVAANVTRWMRFINAIPGDVIELQSLEVPQTRGAPISLYAHATSSAMVVKLLTEPTWLQQAPGLFQIINRIDPRVGGRDEVGKWHRAKRGGTSDRDIIARAVLPIDLDVVRPSGTSTSDAEMALSVAAADAVITQLVPLVGEEAIAYGHSGNGRWVALALDHIEETKDLGVLVREILAALAATHDSKQVKVDIACCDAKRLGPAWGTVKRKGVPSAERPHRTTGILVAPEVRRLSLDDLLALRDMLVGSSPTTSSPPPSGDPAKPRKARGEKGGSRGESAFDLANRVPIDQVVAELGLLRDDGAIGCPRGCSGGTSVVLLKDVNLHKCSHATCADVGPNGNGVRTCVDLWAEMRRIEPADAAKAICSFFGIKVPRRRPKLDAVDPADARPEVFLGSDQEKAADAAIAALEHEPRVYRRSNALVHIIQPGALPEDLRYRDPDPVTIRTVEAPTLEEWISTCARVVELKGEEKKLTRTPLWLVKTVMARSSWPRLRHLESMVATPVLAPDGAVLDKPGYDTRTGLYLTGASLDVPSNPTGADVRGALELLSDLVRDFPFAKIEHRSAWFAAVLTMLARFAFKGASPLFLFDGSTAGSGKTILSGAAAIIGTGQVAPADSLPVERGQINDADLRKELLSWALAARRVVCFDNFKGAPLDSGVLERAITSPVVGGRILGQTRDWSGPLCCTWLLTGNNVEVAGDMQRRVLHIRLEPDCENPEERVFARAFAPYVHDSHRALTRAALIVLRAYCVAGRPDQKLSPWGSFEAWSELVRNAIVWVGWPDPLATREELRRTSATRDNVDRAFIAGWARLVDVSGRKQGWTVSEALSFLFPERDRDGARCPDPELRAAIEELTSGDPDRLGKVLRSLRGRVAKDARGPVHIEITGSARGGVSRWGIARLETVLGENGNGSAKGSGGDSEDGGDPLGHAYAHAGAQAHTRTRARAQTGSEDPNHPTHPHPGESGELDHEEARPEGEDLARRFQ